MVQKRLEGQIAWITGAASGIGEGTAELFAQEGARVALIDVQGERGRQVAERIRAGGGQVLFIEADLSREEEVRRSLEQTARHFGGLQAIINIAGVVNVPDVRDYAATLPYVEYISDNLYSCAQDTQETMTQIIKQKKLITMKV